MTSFTDLNLDPKLVEILRRMEVTEPTPIQEAAIPEMIAGHDIVGQARTGSGKTLAFSIPLLSLCDPELASAQALVLVPTRELAAQVARVIDQLAPATGLRAAQIYGGRDMDAQLMLLNTGPQIIIGTPGRVLDHLYRGTLALRHLRCLVLDEADQMLDIGFAPDVERVLDCAPEGIQIALFSATLPDWVHQVISHRQHDPVMIAVDQNQTGPVNTVDHTVIEVPQHKKIEALRSLLDERGKGTMVIFVRTKIGVERLEQQLRTLGYPAAALQGNLGQAQRERVLRGFRRGQPPILVATNVAARGLDILSIEQVINWDVPESTDMLTHRLGRTGRMGRHGTAVTLLSPNDLGKWKAIEREIGGRTRRERWGAEQPRREEAPQRDEPRQETTRSRSGNRRRRGKQSVTCADCGQQTTVSFVPRADRPVYCNACYRQRRDSTTAA